MATFPGGMIYLPATVSVHNHRPSSPLLLSERASESDLRQRVGPANPEHHVSTRRSRSPDARKRSLQCINVTARGDWVCAVSIDLTSIRPERVTSYTDTRLISRLTPTFSAGAALVDISVGVSLQGAIVESARQRIVIGSLTRISIRRRFQFSGDHRRVRVLGR